MDYNLPQSISEFGNCIFQLLATVIFICVVQYWFIIGIVPLLCLYYMFQHYYRCVEHVVASSSCALRACLLHSDVDRMLTAC